MSKSCEKKRGERQGRKNRRCMNRLKTSCAGALNCEKCQIKAQNISTCKSTKPQRKKNKA